MTRLRMSGSMKTLTKIEAVLTILLVVTVLAMVQVAAWMHSMRESDPVRQLWDPRFSLIFDLLWYIVGGSWAIFTVFYLIVLFLHLGAWIFGRASRPSDGTKQDTRP